MRAIVQETRKARKDLARCPKRILLSYEIWVRLVEEHGIQILRDFKGYYDEKLSGDWVGFRSSRLNIQWRIIYRVMPGKVEVAEVERVTPHDYRR